MDTLYFLMAAAITLLALNIGEQERQRSPRQRQISLVPALARKPIDYASVRPGSAPTTPAYDSLRRQD